MLLTGLIYNNKKKYETSLIYEMLFMTFLVVAAVFTFYIVYQGARHILLCVGMIAVLTLGDKKISIIAAVGLFVIFVGIKWEETEYPLKYDEIKMKKMSQYSELFSNEVQIDIETGTSWENTIAFDMANY